MSDALISDYEQTISAQAAEIERLRGALEGKWRPIGEAPRNGETILVCGGTYCCDDEDFKTYLFRRTKTAYWKRDGWCGGYAKGNDVEYYHRPTHWQPLPPPLQALNGEKENGGSNAA